MCLASTAGTASRSPCTGPTASRNRHRLDTGPGIGSRESGIGNRQGRSRTCGYARAQLLFRFPIPHSRPQKPGIGRADAGRADTLARNRCSDSRFPTPDSRLPTTPATKNREPEGPRSPRRPRPAAHLPVPASRPFPPVVPSLEPVRRDRPASGRAEPRPPRASSPAAAGRRPGGCGASRRPARNSKRTARANGVEPSRLHPRPDGPPKRAAWAGAEPAPPARSRRRTRGARGHRCRWLSPGRACSRRSTRGCRRCPAQRWGCSRPSAWPHSGRKHDRRCRPPR